MAEKPSTVAIVALCLSIGTAAFAVFQWWKGTQDSRINAAIELSNKHIAETTVSGSAIPDLARKQLIGTGTAERYINRLEYTAYLANDGRIDVNYLALSLRCEIAALPNKLLGDGRYVVPESAKFAAREKPVCVSPHSN
jgi:hypothetical protein